MKSITTLAVVAALGAGALQVAAPGDSESPGPSLHSTPIPTPRSGPALPSRPEQRAARTHPGHVRQSGPGTAKHAHPRTGRGNRPAGSQQSTAQPGGAAHISTPAIQQTSMATPAAPSPSAATEPVRHGPLRNLGNRNDQGSHPIRQGVAVVVSAPDLPGTLDHVRDGLPVKVPPLPAHP